MSIEDPYLVPAINRRREIRTERTSEQPMSQMELEARLAEVTGKIDAIKELGGGLYAEAGRLERDGGDAKETRDFAQLVESSVDPRGLEALLDEQRILKQRLAQLRIDNSQA